METSPYVPYKGVMETSPYVPYKGVIETSPYVPYKGVMETSPYVPYKGVMETSPYKPSPLSTFSYDCVILSEEMVVCTTFRQYLLLRCFHGALVWSIQGRHGNISI